MSFPRDAYPYTNFHELNLGYFIVHFREIFSQWADLYDQMLDWKDATTDELTAWKTGVVADLDQREAALRAELETWKAQTGQDIAGWEYATLAALTAWQTATQAVFEAIRVEAAGSATAAAASAGDAATAKTAAETAQAAAEAAAASIASSAAQIATNTSDIADLKTQIGSTKDAIINGSYPFDLIPNSYVLVNGDFVDYNGWSRTDFIPCGEYKSILTYRTAGNGSVYNCFYNANKTRIASFSTGAINEEKTIDIPDDAEYVVFSDDTRYINALTITFQPTTKEILSRTATIVDEISEESCTPIKNTSTGVTHYSETGYIRSNDGAFVPHTSYDCYYFTMTNTSNVWVDSYEGWLQIAVYDGTAFDVTKFKKIATSSDGTIPTKANPLSIEGGMTVAVCVAINQGFTIQIGTGTYIVKTAEIPAIIIRPKYATQFSVDVLDEETGKYITYQFFHPTFTDEIEYSQGLSKELVTYDVWFNNNVNDENGNLIFQGNTNFIHALSDTGHIGHVGAGHGCTVMDCFMFFADGEKFDPATLNHEIYCTSFRFIIKAKHYMIDDSITTSPSHAMPYLDANGDPVITSEWVFDGTWEVNNKISMTNHLEIKHNNITFRQCHAGMLCGFYPNIDNTALEGRNGLYWNSTNGTQCTDESESGVTFTAGATTSIIADSATLFGNSYVARQDFNNKNPQMYGKENVLAWMPPTSDNRLKMYLMPCVCTESTALTDEGKSVDVFNVGDSIDVSMVRTIKVKPN